MIRQKSKLKEIRIQQLNEKIQEKLTDRGTNGFEKNNIYKSLLNEKNKRNIKNKLKYLLNHKANKALKLYYIFLIIFYYLY